MKKILNKLRGRKNPPPPSRITTETVAEHREHILAGGRRFKYPLQYSKHKLVFNTIIIGVLAIIITITIGWWQLYVAQNTTEFMYRVTKVIPVPIANVDGQTALYSDYLMYYRSSVYSSEQQQQLDQKSADGKRQIDYIKKQSMESVISDAYAQKMSKSLNVSISDSELDAFIKDKRMSPDGEISQQTYDAATLDILGWTPDEYKYRVKIGMLRRKVSYAMDKDALDTINLIEDAIKKNPTINFQTLAADFSTKSGKKVNYGASGWVPINNYDGGLSVAANKLDKLGFSLKIERTTAVDGYYGYYIVRLLDKNSTRLSYEYINVQATEFLKSLEKIKKDGKVSQYISMPK